MSYLKMSIFVSSELARAAVSAVKESVITASKVPVIKEAFRSGLLMSAGDVVCQLGIEKREVADFDVARNLRMTGFGFFLAGPAFFKWYKFLDGKIKAQGFKAALKKTFFDQTVFAPSMLVGFLAYNEIMLGHSMEAVKKRIENSYWETQMINWSVVPGLQLANFYFLPAAYRVVVVQLIAVFRNTVLALAVGNKKPQEVTTEAKEEKKEIVKVSGGKEGFSILNLFPNALFSFSQRADYYQRVYRISFNLF
ncbi:protein Mpv17-like [Artemia franciscana]